MKEIALHILDIAENSVAAGAQTVQITIEEDVMGNRIRMSVRDDGKGMDVEKLACVGDPFTTSRTTRVAGLGIPFLKAAAEECNGGLHVNSTPEDGTLLEAEFQMDHIDRMPLGDLAGTMLSLVVGSPDITWQLYYQVNGKTFHFDSQPIREELGDVPLTEPSILRFVREMLQEGIADVQQAKNREARNAGSKIH